MQRSLLTLEGMVLDGDPNPNPNPNPNPSPNPNPNPDPNPKQVVATKQQAHVLNEKRAARVPNVAQPSHHTGG